MIDVFAVPDYRSYIKPHARVQRAFQTVGNQNLGQLQFIITRTNVCDLFPLGVKTFYRAYPTDEAIELVMESHLDYRHSTNKQRSLSGLIPTRVIVVDRPSIEDNNGIAAGMRCLNSLPVGPVPVADFKAIKGDKGKKLKVIDSLSSMVEKMETKHPNSYVGTHWREFYDKFPKYSAQEYIITPGNNYHQPFAKFFDGTDISLQGRDRVEWVNCGTARTGIDRIISVDTQSSVNWGPLGRGWCTCLGRVQTFQHPRLIRNHEAHGLNSAYIRPNNNDNRDSNSPLNPNWKVREYKDMKKVELVNLLKDRGLPYSGNIDKLIERLEVNDTEMGNDANEPPAPIGIAVQNDYNREIDDEVEVDIADNGVVADNGSSEESGALLFQEASADVEDDESEVDEINPMYSDRNQFENAWEDEDEDDEDEHVEEED
jgi:hypothetical protein